jgi:DNA-directed RNA polymerases I, II, and III subunit RPABC3
MDLLLDLNVDIYPVEMGDCFNIAIASSLSLHGQPDDGNVYDQSNQASLLDRYDYAMYGRVFRYQEDKSRGNRVYVM